MSFNWNYSTADEDQNTQYDPFGYLINGIFTQQTDDSGGISQNGTSTFNVGAGDNFGFRIATVDNVFGRGSVTISNFSTLATPVPFESNALPVVSATLFLAAGVWCKRKLAKKAVYIVDSHHKQ